MINKERLVDKFLKYVQIDSPTKNERKFADFLKKEMERIGLEVTMDSAGDKVEGNSGNLIGKLKGNTDGETILFSAHMDTVSPGIGIKPIIKDGVIYSDGTTVLGADDKAGIAAIMEALEVISENNILHGDMEVVFTIYEEGGLFGAKNLDYSNLKAKNAFVLDSSKEPGEVIINGPAQNKINVKFIGKAAHAGVAPEKGISAIQMSGVAIGNMNLLRIDEVTTANIGIICGGDSTNVVPEEVVFKAEARSLCNDKLKAQTDHMIKCCEDAAEKFGGKVEVEVINSYPAFKVEEEDEIVKNFKVACEKLGLNFNATSSGGGCDANILNAHGITAVNLGIGERKPHTLEEHYYIKDLENVAKLALEIIKLYA